MRDESDQDCSTIKVRVDGAHAPYLLIAMSQVPQVQVLFDSIGLKYTLSDQASEPAEGCALTTLTFASETSADEIQRILDELD